ncbi:uncharacterized protein C3orf22 homolog isoform X2 [Sarcophilus harrisii]|uniref:uncharacterized protein C3orf22 homolog isoform X2 n=1 Tax=Sarcophilus harrisii TaxID=9305 RepID=UPI001301AC9D|nr:uncharacterized protein C3orf22 homolog isoform X2 [Sarcophilus harrisii]XP_031811878.1 uncharacterized protein C3orf22 homolog isoform X2 [Sarcophilus harrisii]XP_031811882.1 uncharacterized protein C3orf22 homolog isoform X2 [Sarcophilus harrisii]
MEAEQQRSDSSVKSNIEQKIVPKEQEMEVDLKKDQHKDVVNPHKNCGLPISLPIYPGIQAKENANSWTHVLQNKIVTHSKSKKEEDLEEFALSFPYRLTRLSTDSEMSRTKPWDAQKMLGQLREKLPLQKNLLPTRSIPSKANHVLVAAMIPPSRTTYIPPLRSPLEDKLLSTRFPKQKARLQELLGYHMYGWLMGNTEAPSIYGPHLVVEFNDINFPPSTIVHSS